MLLDSALELRALEVRVGHGLIFGIDTYNDVELNDYILDR